MKKTVSFLLCAMLLATAQVAYSRQIVAVSKIADVTVFNDRAMVKRVAAVKLEKGENVITFEGLPLQIAEDSLRAEGQGAANARISGLSVRNVFLDSNNQKRIRDIEVEIQALERSVLKIDARRSALAAQRAFVDSIKTGWGERISKELTLGKPAVAELNDASRFVGDSVLKIEDGLFDAAAEKKPLLDRIAALKKQLADISSSRDKEIRAVELTVDAAAAMDFKVELSYLVSQARWEPLYDIRLAPDGRSAELHYRAVVSQSSGEDWQGVNLALSTATPSSGSAPPELQPWQINFLEPVRPLPRYSRTMMKAAAPAPMAETADANPFEYAGSEPVGEFLQATEQTSQAMEGQTSVQFVISKPVDIPSDGSRQSSLIALERIPVKAEFVTVPKLSPGVFLKSEVVNSTEYPLLAGAMNVFNDAAFVGRSYLKAVAAGEKFDLFFGAVDSVKIKRQVTRVRKAAGLLAGNSVTWKCSVELENFRKDEIALSLFDQIPVAGNQEIKVALKDVQPTSFETLPEGKVVWKLLLKPGEKKTVTYQIEVEYPKGREISGAE
jgi:uncharacterized protein (TIGR02231 family)